MPETDEQLLERTLASDEEAFRLLFEKYQPILFRAVLHRLRDVDTAHDIVQETFLRVWQHRTTLKPGLPFLPYIFRISNNLVLDHAKHKEVRRRLEADIPVPSSAAGDDPEDSLRVSMLEEKLSEVVWTKLPARCREVFLLSRLEEMSNSEISERLGISVKTVENQITRALKTLRRYLRRYAR